MAGISPLFSCQQTIYMYTKTQRYQPLNQVLLVKTPAYGVLPEKGVE